MTGYNEARPVINTCIAIMEEVSSNNPCASFGFIGANMLNETEVDTKRFRVYRHFMATYFTENTFEHLFNAQKSAYIMLRKTEMEKHPELLSVLMDRFIELYPYFE
jgi:hypothetical protein